MTYTAYKPEQVANDFAVNWLAINPTPKVGQICFESNTGLFKIGNGTSAYNDLPYAGGGGGGGSSSGNIDGGSAGSVYGGTTGLSGGGA